MKPSIVYCPGGEPSQSGSAVKVRYPDVNITDCGGITKIPASLNTNKGPYVVPIWNSNQGEIEASEYVWDLIKSEQIRILDLWPKRIEFWFVVRSGANTNHGLIGSVIVAESQCSKFLLTQNVELEPYGLTNYAFDAYKKGAKLDGVLVAPWPGKGEKGYDVINKQTANDNNFTSFVKICPSPSTVVSTSSTSSCLTGVTMSSLSGTVLNHVQLSFFDNLFSADFNLEDIPKLIFVFKRTSTVGLLFEGSQFTSGDFLNAEDLDTGEILVHENVGELDVSYAMELETLLTSEFPNLKQPDFILHIGKNTFLFACPLLCMYTHGYDKDAVEPVFRLYIDKIFEFIDNEGKCNIAQTELFNRHKDSWEKQRSKFITFTIIDSSK